MLRIAVISLVVANLLLLGLKSSNPPVKPDTVEPEPAVEDSSIPTIHLFSEMLQDQDLLSGNRRCFSLGPFHSEEDKNEVRTRLVEVSSAISERQTQALVEKGYWVFMTPFQSLLEANEELISLQALGLSDIVVVYDGDWKNAISLGYFLRQENALRRQKSLEDRGYAPLVRVQRYTEPRYWLDYEQDPGSGLIALDMQSRPNDFMQRSLPCPDKNLFEIDSIDPAGFAGDSALNQPAEGNVESQPVQSNATDLGENAEDLAIKNDIEVPGSVTEVIPVAIDSSVSGDPTAPMSGQVIENEQEAGTEPEIDGGQDSG